MHTITEIRRTTRQEIETALGDYRLLCMEDVRGYQEVTLPLITYSVKAAINYRRGYDELTKTDMQEYVGSATEMIPHDITVTIQTHSDSMEEADDLYHAALRAFGMSPLFAGIGCKLVTDGPRPHELLGVYAHLLQYVGWTLLEGRTDYAPLIREIRIPVSGEDLPTEPVTITEDDIP